MIEKHRCLKIIFQSISDNEISFDPDEQLNDNHQGKGCV
jgi:hypothetical protein